jgi:uncharacterized protein (DUF1015 family)
MRICPFRGIRYNQTIVGDLTQIICPPYDVISPEEQRVYYEKSNHNAVRLELPGEYSELTVDRYQSAGIAFRRWLRDGILQRDGVSGFYLHRHEFEYSGRRKVRHGLVARVELEPWGNGIYPHEETGSKAKSDRLHLMRTCRASFSPLLCLYHESGGRVAAILSGISREKPLVSTRAEPGNFPETDEIHVLWAITEQEKKRELSRLLSSVPLYIADGHHRYETALTYRRERTQEESGTGRGAVNYVMIELVDFSDEGVVVLPLHRLVRGVRPELLAKLTDQLSDFFAVDSVALEADNCQVPAASWLGVLGLQPGLMVILRRREDISLDAMMPADRSRAYREFGVSILNHVVLDRMLGGTDNLEVTYTVDSEEAYQKVIEQGEYELAFLLTPPRPEAVKAVADAGDRMPRKSTYFYPKVPAGLIIHSLE